jgi:hypothetical protein
MIPREADKLVPLGIRETRMLVSREKEGENGE